MDHSDLTGAITAIERALGPSLYNILLSRQNPEPLGKWKGPHPVFFPVISFDLLENVPFNKFRVFPVHLMRLVREFLRGPAMWLITKW